MEMTAKQQAKKERELLNELVDLGCKFRNTPIVDNDFPSQRDAFDSKLSEAELFVKENKPLIVNTTSMIQDGCMGQQPCVVTTVQRRD